MGKRNSELAENKKKEWMEFVKKHKDFFEELAKKVKR